MSGKPLDVHMLSPARRKMLLCNIFAGLRSLCSVRRRTHRTASQRSLVRRTCRRTSGICRRGAPLHPVFSLLRPDEKCCCATFLPDFVPCAPCAGALTALRHRGRLSAAPVAVQAGSAAGGSPAPRFNLSGQTKNVAVQHFCRTSFLVLRARAHSPHRVTEVACPPHLSPYKRDLP